MPAIFTSTSAFQFILLSILTGLIGAFIYPLLSYFLVEQLKVEPIYIGVYMVLVTLSGLAISQYLGRLADQGYSARKMYILANSGIILALLVYMNTNLFAVVLLAGVFFMAFGNASVPQMLTLSRQWTQDKPVDITQFNARIRAGISFAWMIGPPLGFTLVAYIGFTATFSMAVLVACIGIMFVALCIPEQPAANKPITNEPPTKAPLSFWFLALAIVMGSMGNNMYTSALPLYTINELALPRYTPGVLMGLVAGLEIPIMLWSSRLCQRFSKTHIMLAAFCFGCVFYIGVFNATTFAVLLALQVVNALFYGLFAGVGLTLMQEQLPARIGFTSAVYSNGFKIGVMVGASCMGVIAQYFSFRYALLGAAAASALGAVFLGLFLNHNACSQCKLSQDAL